VNERLVTAIAFEDQDRLHTRTMQCNLQAIARGSAKLQTALIERLTDNKNKQWRIAAGAVASLD
jgi:hypothetical protein